MQMYFCFFLCTEICLLTGKYENVSINSCNESDMCNEPDFAIISNGKRKRKFLFGSLASGFFCYLAVMLFSFDTPV